MLSTSLNEGRQPVTPIDGAGCGACGCGFVGHAPGGPRDSALRALRPVREELAERPAPVGAGAQTRPGDRAVRLEPRTKTPPMMRREAAGFARTRRIRNALRLSAHHSPHLVLKRRARPRRPNNRAGGALPFSYPSPHERSEWWGGGRRSEATVVGWGASVKVLPKA
jgi:hypothetical protein